MKRAAAKATQQPERRVRRRLSCDESATSSPPSQPNTTNAIACGPSPPLTPLGIVVAPPPPDPPPNLADLHFRRTSPLAIVCCCQYPRHPLSAYNSSRARPYTLGSYESLWECYGRMSRRCPSSFTASEPGHAVGDAWYSTPRRWCHPRGSGCCIADLDFPVRTRRHHLFPDNSFDKYPNYIWCVESSLTIAMYC